MVITIFVRHSPGCKYAGDEFHKACRCRKHLRWSRDGKQFRKTADTRSWEQAETAKRNLEAQLNGTPLPGASEAPQQTIEKAIQVFLADKANQELTASVIGKYTREMDRLQTFCEASIVFTVAGITREILVQYVGTWPELYPSTITRAKARERLRSFLRFCYEAQWIPRIPPISKIKVDQAPTLPLTAEEYNRLLKHAATPRIRALVQLMRWTGLAIRDAVTLEREEIQHDPTRKLYRIVTSRQKTGTHVSVPLPPAVAKEVLTVLNGNPKYVFWTGNGLEESAVTNWQHDLRKLFRDANVKSVGNMLSHRLRDTFAVDLLEKGVPLEEVSKLLGHESIKTTEKHYSKWMKGRQDRLDKLVTGTWEK